MESETQLPALEALSSIPGSETVHFARGQQIYGPEHPSTDVYRVTEGRVKVTRLSGERVTVLVDIYFAGDLFGESALLNLPRNGEQAVALGPVKAVKWSADLLSETLAFQPRFAVALIGVVAARCAAFKDRMESLSAEDTMHRLARALIHFGSRAPVHRNGDATLEPLTHEMLAQYVGTSREIISHHMSTLRRHAYISYSRKGILVHTALQDWLDGKLKAQHA